MPYCLGLSHIKEFACILEGVVTGSMPKRHAELAISDAFGILDFIAMVPDLLIAVNPLRSFSGPRPQGHTCLGRCGQQRPPSQSSPGEECHFNGITEPSVWWDGTIQCNSKHKTQVKSIIFPKLPWLRRISQSANQFPAFPQFWWSNVVNVPSLWASLFDFVQTSGTFYMFHMWPAPPLRSQHLPASPATAVNP